MIQPNVIELPISPTYDGLETVTFNPVAKKSLETLIRVPHDFSLSLKKEHLLNHVSTETQTTELMVLLVLAFQPQRY